MNIPKRITKRANDALYDARTVLVNAIVELIQLIGSRDCETVDLGGYIPARKNEPVKVTERPKFSQEIIMVNGICYHNNRIPSDENDHYNIWLLNDGDVVGNCPDMTSLIAIYHALLKVVRHY